MLKCLAEKDTKICGSHAASGAMAFLYGGWLLLRGQIPDSIQAAKADEIPSFFSSPIDRLIEKEIQFEETSGTSPAPEGFAASVSTEKRKEPISDFL